MNSEELHSIPHKKFKILIFVIVSYGGLPQEWSCCKSNVHESDASFELIRYRHPLGNVPFIEQMGSRPFINAFKGKNGLMSEAI